MTPLSSQSCFNSGTFWWFWCGQRYPSNEAFRFVLFVLSKVRNWLHPSPSHAEKRTVSLSGKLNQRLGTESWTVPFPNSFSFLSRGLIQSINREKGKDPIRINWTETEESTQVIAFWLEVSRWKWEMWLERSIKACHQRRDTEYFSSSWSHCLGSLPGLRSEHPANHLRAGKFPTSAKDTPTLP